MLISFSSLAAMGKIQKNTYTKMRPEGLININTKEQQKITPPCDIWLETKRRVPRGSFYSILKVDLVNFS